MTVPTALKPPIHLPRWLQAVLPLLLGAASSLGYAPYNAWPIWLLAHALWLLLLQWQRGGWCVWTGFAFGWAAAASTMHWIGVALWVQPNFPKLTGMIGTASAWTYSAWPWCAVGLLWAWQGGRRAAWSLMLASVAVLGGAWWSLAWFFWGGFPWLVPSTVWLDTWLQGWGPVGGGLLMAVWGVVLAASLAQGLHWLLTRGAVRSRHKWLVLHIGIWVLAWGVGLALQSVQWTQPQGKPVHVGVVQIDMPGVARRDKQEEHAYLRMAWRVTSALIQRHAVDVVLWPEAVTASAEAPLRHWLSQHDDLLQGRSLALGVELAQPGGDGKNVLNYNSILAYGNQAHGRYDKRQLVPLIERAPTRGVWPWLDEWAKGAVWNREGLDDQAPLQLAGQAVAASICYEDVYAQSYQNQPAEVGWLINASNDRWFAHSAVMPPQHLALSRLRALEQQRPLVRAANIGSSAVIDMHGRIQAQTETRATRMLHAHLQPRHGLTPYARFGHSWLLGLLGLGMGGLAYSLVRSARAMPVR